MSTAHVVVTLLAAAMVGFSAASVFLRTPWVVQPLADYGVPRSWWPWLGTAKAAAAVGLLVGLFMPLIGAIATCGIVLYSIGAVAVVVRARMYSHAVLLLL